MRSLATIIVSATVALLIGTGGSSARAIFDRHDSLTEYERQEWCGLPPITTGAKFIIVSADIAVALSSAAVGSQDEITTTASVQIEPGEEPLYVVFISLRPIVWRFSGAVDRIEHVALAGSITGPNGADSPPLLGATGLPAERITMVRRSQCYRYFSEVQSIAGATTIAALKQAVGRAPDLVSAASRLLRIALPSRSIEAYSQSYEPKAPYASAEFPGGIVDIDPSTVVASQPVVAYEVPPSKSGLMLLLETGALSLNRDGEYLIHRKIRLPAGLSRERFLLLRDVPEPSGDLNQSCVVSEDTGRVLGNGSC